MRPISILDWIAFILVIVGGLSWGLIGLLRFDLVSSLFGEMSFASRTIFGLVGISAVYLIFRIFIQPKISVNKRTI